LKAISGKDFCRLLEKHGWQVKRIAGSHHINAKLSDISRISVPVHGNSSLKSGLQQHLMKLAGISEDEL